MAVPTMQVTDKDVVDAIHHIDGLDETDDVHLEDVRVTAERVSVTLDLPGPTRPRQRMLWEEVRSLLERTFPGIQFVDVRVKWHPSWRDEEG